MLPFWSQASDLVYFVLVRFGGSDTVSDQEQAKLRLKSFFIICVVSALILIAIVIRYWAKRILFELKGVKTSSELISASEWRSVQGRLRKNPDYTMEELYLKLIVNEDGDITVASVYKVRAVTPVKFF